MYDDTIQDLYKDIEKLRRRVEYLERLESDTVTGAISDGYLNFSGTGESGYGFRDNAGAMEVKDDGTAWYPIARTNRSSIALYVDGTAGSDSTGDGTIGAPFATPNKALSMLPQFITNTAIIYLAKATYSTSIDISSYMGNALVSFRPYDADAGKSMYCNSVAATAGEVSSTTIGSTTLDLADLSGGKVWITAGTGQGQVRSIDSNTTTTITVTSPWGTTPDTTSRFSCCAPVKISTSATYAITDTGKSFTMHGLWIVSTGTYAFYVSNYASANIYSCYIEPTGGGMQFANFAFVSIRYNCIELSASNKFAVLIGTSSNITAFGNVFTSASATGTNGFRLTYGSFLYAGLNTTTYPYNYISGMAVGVQLYSNSAATSLEFQTYSGCTTNYAGQTDFYGYIIQGAQVVSNTFHKTLVNSTATSVFRIASTNKSGSNDGGGWTCWVHALITHGNSSTTTASASKGITAQFCRAMLGAGTGVNSTVSEVTVTPSAATNAATRDIGAVTISLKETSEYNIDVQITADATGSSVDVLEATVMVQLIHYGFLTAPTMTQL